MHKKKMKTLYIRSFRIFIIIASVATFSALMDYPHIVSDAVREYNLDNPMYDVFYLYYADQRDDALSILNRAMKSRKHREAAFINRGVIEYYEGRHASALKWYDRSLSHGYTATTYILDHAAGRDMELYNKTLTRLETVKDIKGLYWVAYERASRYARKGDTATALALLEKACKNGFDHAGLIRNDPAWKRVRHHPSYKKMKNEYLVHDSKGNATPEILDTSLALAKGTPLDISPELAVAYRMLSRRKDVSALPYLTRVITTSSNQRHIFIARYWRARVYTRQGKKDKAKKELTQCRNILASLPEKASSLPGILLPLFSDIIENDPVLKKL